MFDSIAFPELVLICIVAIVVVGPKDLPLLARKMGRWTKKIRGMAMEFRASFDDLARQAELDELRKEVESLRTMQPFRDVESALSERIDLGAESGAGSKQPEASNIYANKIPSGPLPVAEMGEATMPVDGAGAGSMAAEKPKKPRAPRKRKTTDVGAAAMTPAGDA
jgi:sec-independent protein translocase protein TatB